MKTITILVQDQEIQLPQLGHRRAKGWRKEFEQVLVALAPKLKTVDPAVLKAVDLTKTEELESLISALFGLVEDALDEALKLVLAYGDGAITGKETVEDDIYDEEIVSNFILVVRTAIPFDKLMDMFKVMNSGQLPATTSTNSDQSGDINLTTTA